MAEHDWYPPQARVQKCKVCGVMSTNMSGTRKYTRSNFNPGQDGSIGPNDKRALEDCQEEMTSQVFDE